MLVTETDPSLIGLTARGILNLTFNSVLLNVVETHHFYLLRALSKNIEDYVVDAKSSNIFEDKLNLVKGICKIFRFEIED